MYGQHTVQYYTYSTILFDISDTVSGSVGSNGEAAGQWVGSGEGQWEEV